MRKFKFVKLVYLIGLGVLFAWSPAAAQGAKSAIAISDFQGVTKHPALLPALTQEVSDALATHPNVIMASRESLVEFMKQSGVKQIYSGNAPQVTVATQSHVLVTGEVMEDADGIATKVRVYKADGSSVGSRRIVSNYQSLATLPAQICEAIGEIIGLAPHAYPQGSGNLGSLIDFGKGLKQGDAGKYGDAAKSFSAAKSQEATFQLSDTWQKRMSETGLQKSTDPFDKVRLLLLQGDKETAAAELAKLQAQGVYGVPGTLLRAELLLGNNDAQGAQRELDGLINSGISDPLVFMNLGKALRAMGKVEESVKALEKAIQLDSANTEIRINLAEMYQFQGDFKKSAQEFKKAADMVLDEHNYQGALVLYRRAKVLGPQDMDLLTSEGKVLIELNSADEAASVLEAAHKMDPTHAETNALLGRVYILKGQTARGFELLQKAYKADALGFSVNYYLGLYYVMESKKESDQLALSHLKAAVAADPKHQAALLALARLFRAMGLHEEARSAYDKLHTMDPSNYYLAKEYADLMRDTQHYQEAELLYSEAVRVNPDFLEAHEGLGEVYKSQGDNVRAAQAFDKARSIDPDSGMSESVLHKQMAGLVRSFPSRARTEFGIKPIDKVALLGVYEQFDDEKFHQKLIKYLNLLFRFEKPDLQLFTSGFEREIQQRYNLLYLDTVKAQAKSAGYGNGRFDKPEILKSVCQALNTDGAFEIKIHEVPAEKNDDLKIVQFQVTAYFFERVSSVPGYYKNQTTVKVSRDDYLKTNYLPFLVYALIAGFVGLVIFRIRKIGYGNVRVSIRYDKTQAAGYFSLKLSKDANDKWAVQAGKGSKKFTKKASFRKKSEEYMVGDETVFKKFRAGQYYIFLFGNIAEKVNREKIIGTFSMSKPVTIKKKEEVVITFNLVEEEAYVEVLVRFQDQLIGGAEVFCRETKNTQVTKADQGAGFHLKPGKYNLTASWQDLKTNLSISIDDIKSKEVLIEMHDANRHALQGDYLKAAEIFLHHNDELEAARMFERGGELTRACQVLGEKYIREENFAKALACYERSQDFDSMGALHQRMGEMEKAYRCFGNAFLKSEHFDDAIRMFAESKDFDLLAQAFAGKGDTKNQLKSLGFHHKKRGEDLEAAGAFERGEEFIEAGEAYEKVGNHAKAGEMYVKGDEHGRAAEFFLKAGDTVRAAMAFEKAGMPDRAADLYQNMGDVAKAPKVLFDAGKFMDAAKAYRSSGLLDEALGSLRMVGANHKDFQDACEMMATIFEEKGEIGLAVQAAQRALENQVIDNSNLERFHRFGKRQEQAGEINEAIRTYEKILSVNMEYEDLAHHVREMKENLHARTMVGTSNLLGGQAQSGAAAGGTSRYEIVKEIGRGGMGIVYQAKDKLLERTVALKILPENIKDNQEAMAAFLKEAKAAAKLTHPNLVTVYDTGQENGNFFITMEFVEGQTLKQLLQRSTKFLKAGDIVAVSLMICDGLNYAHQSKVIHRDIKPSNIMINKNRQVKIMDFGLATVMQNAALDKTMMRGTPLYMAPEMILGRNVDYRSDIYSIGISMYEMAAKRVPFATGDVAYHHLHTAPPPIEQFNANIPAELNALIMKAVAKKQEERFQSIEEIIAELRKIERSLQNNPQVAA